MFICFDSEIFHGIDLCDGKERESTSEVTSAKILDQYNADDFINELDIQSNNWKFKLCVEETIGNKKRGEIVPCFDCKVENIRLNEEFFCSQLTEYQCEETKPQIDWKTWIISNYPNIDDWHGQNNSKCALVRNVTVHAATIRNDNSNSNSNSNNNNKSNDNSNSNDKESSSGSTLTIDAFGKFIDQHKGKHVFVSQKKSRYNNDDKFIVALICEKYDKGDSFQGSILVVKLPLAQHVENWRRSPVFAQSQLKQRGMTKRNDNHVSRSRSNDRRMGNVNNGDSVYREWQIALRMVRKNEKLFNFEDALCEMLKESKSRITVHKNEHCEISFFKFEYLLSRLYDSRKDGNSMKKYIDCKQTIDPKRDYSMQINIRMTIAPNSKELKKYAQLYSKYLISFADKCGNIHLFVRSKSETNLESEALMVTICKNKMKENDFVYSLQFTTDAKGHKQKKQQRDKFKIAEHSQFMRMCKKMDESLENSLLRFMKYHIGRKSVYIIVDKIRDFDVEKKFCLNENSRSLISTQVKQFVTKVKKQCGCNVGVKFPDNSNMNNKSSNINNSNKTKSK